MKATKSEAAYREAEIKGRTCGTCEYMLDSGACRKVQGQVDRKHVCDYWEREK